MKKFILFIALFYSAILSFSQEDICGVWVNETSHFYAVIIIYNTENNQIQGVTYDKENNTFCCYLLDGKYKNEKLKAKNTAVIEKSYNHNGGRYKLKYTDLNNNQFLTGNLSNGLSPFIAYPLSLLFLSPSLSSSTKSIDLKYKKISPEEYVNLKGKEYLQPYLNKLDSGNCACIKDTTPIVDSTISPLISERKNTIVNTYQINLSSVKLKVSDWNKVDGDTLNIFLNNELIETVSLKKRDHVININFPDNEKENTLTFVASNLGALQIQLKLKLLGKRNHSVKIL